MYSTSLENKCRTLFIWTNVDQREEVSEAGQVRDKCDAEVLGVSYRY